MVILRLMYALACVAGCVYQVALVCHLYFKFETTSKFLQDVSDRTSPPDFAFCARYPELMRSATFRPESEVGIRKTTEEEFVNLIQLFSEHSLDQVFDETPPPEGE